MYQATSSPEDAIAAHNWETLRGWSFLDVAVRENTIICLKTI